MSVCCIAISLPEFRIPVTKNSRLDLANDILFFQLFKKIKIRESQINNDRMKKVKATANVILLTGTGIQFLENS